MVTKKWKKTIKSLQNKKQRDKKGLFVVEGLKAVNELLQSSFEVETVYYTSRVEQEIIHPRATMVELSELNEISGLSTNHDALAVARKPEPMMFGEETQRPYLTLVLDGIQDPGNLGTIIRTADWYGISRVVCSPETVDFFNSKTIQATMGSFTRVMPEYTPLNPFIKHEREKHAATIYGAVMSGRSVRQLNPAETNNILVMGQESHGISQEIEALLDDGISIPGGGRAESLNVAMATGILLDNFAARQ